MNIYVTEVLLTIRPNGNFVVRDNDFNQIEYLDDDCERVTIEEYKIAENAYIEKMRKLETEKAAARQAILERLGITDEEAKLLLS